MDTNWKELYVLQKKNETRVKYHPLFIAGDVAAAILTVDGNIADYNCPQLSDIVLLLS
jgi:hypothetical protein